MRYEPVIGLEVHVQLNTRSKLFSSCSTSFGAEPNSNTSPVCFGWPGSLPVLNEAALRLAIKAGLALNCEIARFTKFDRKHYFYPDLPKAYQISQYDLPINGRGWLRVKTRLASGEVVEKKIGITRAHLEEDAGKLLHEGVEDGTLIDYNRAGIPLLEIVSEPDIRSPQEAYDYLTALKAILQYLEVSDCNMEEGSLRCDGNISVRPEGQKKFGTKTEIKNLNSFRAVQKSLEYEIRRQTELLETGGTVSQETRLWNDVRGETVLMRSKEEAHDYRYFPEPDLVPTRVSEEMIERIRAELPELPMARAERFVRDFGLQEADALVLVQDRLLAGYFEACLAEKVPAKTASNWIQSELLALLNQNKAGIEACPVSPEALAGLIRLIDEGTISGKIAKDVLVMMYETGRPAADLVREKGLVQVSDTSFIEKIADRVIAANEKSVADYRAGKGKALGFLVGQIMKETGGKANPGVVNEILTKKLSG